MAERKEGWAFTTVKAAAFQDGGERERSGRGLREHQCRWVWLPPPQSPALCLIRWCVVFFRLAPPPFSALLSLSFLCCFFFFLFVSRRNKRNCPSMMSGVATRGGLPPFSLFVLLILFFLFLSRLLLNQLGNVCAAVGRGVPAPSSFSLPLLSSACLSVGFASRKKGWRGVWVEGTWLDVRGVRRGEGVANAKREKATYLHTHEKKRRTKGRWWLCCAVASSLSPVISSLYPPFF